MCVSFFRRNSSVSLIFRFIFSLYVFNLWHQGELDSVSRTCVSGHSCSIGALGDPSTSALDAYLILDTCGHPSSFDTTAVYGASGALIQLNAPVSGGLYRLCWCAVQANHTTSGTCASASDFQTDLGSLIIRGPAPLGQAFTCIAGQRCQLRGLTGQDLASSDQILLLDTCGVPVAKSGVHIRFAADSDSLFFNSDMEAMISGGKYRLCWCGSLPLLPLNGTVMCNQAVEFPTDVGSLTVIGPSPLAQHTTCIGGKPCAIQLTGDLSTGDFLVAETCGTSGSNILTGLATLGNAANVAASSWLQSSNGTSTSVYFPPGMYRLCWCAQGQRCSTQDDFNLDVGSLSILGRSPLQQDRTCVAGRECEIDSITGFGLDNDARMMIMDTCGGDAYLKGLPENGRFQVITASGSTGSWGSMSLSSAGGQYRLCWCGPLQSPISWNASSGFASSACEVSDFTLDMGAFHILGPVPHSQSWTCISGRRCEIDGIRGFGIGSNDSFLVLETCGHNAVVTGFPDSGMVSEISANGAEIWWNGEISAFGGIYRLCWCPHASTCSTGDAFHVDFGELLLLGPAQSDHTCISAQSCRLNGLSFGSYMILETCGLSGPLGQAAESQEGQVSWETLSPPGIYQLCWCTDPSNATNAPCQLSSQYGVRVGTMTIVGPTPEQTATCISGHVCFVGIEGIHLPGSQMLVMDTCGIPPETQLAPGFPGTAQIRNFSSDSLMSSIFSWGEVHVTPPGGTYRMCWCGDLSACSQGKSFVVDFGRLAILGPSPLQQHQTCISGLPCPLQAKHAFDGGSVGNGTEISTYILVLDTCGTPFAPTGFPTSTALGVNVRNASSFRTAAPGGSYRLCWCSEDFAGASGVNSSTLCEVPENFRSDFGELMVIGPREQSSITCISGQVCALNQLDLLGVLVSNESGSSSDVHGFYMALDTCGEAALEPFGYVGRISATWPFGVAITAGNFRLCWCGSMSANATSCAEAYSFLTSAGTLSISGPMPNQDRTCVSGQSCMLDGLVGIGLPDFKNAVIVLETCGTAAEVSGFPQPALATEGGGLQVMWGGRISTAGGLYRLCWTLSNDALNASNLTHPTVSHAYNVDFGSLMIIGPSPLQQTMTCIAGQRCVFDALPGYGMLSGHYIQVADTCGVLSENTDFPSAELQAPNFTHYELPEMFAPGKSYRLCWCASGFSCSKMEFFQVDVGTLRIVAPEPLNQGRTCVSGRSCTFAASMNTAGQMMIMETCGTIQGLPEASPGAAVTDFFGSVGLVSWPLLLLQGGLYRLCWCASDVGLCKLPSGFSVDLGSLMVLGPERTQSFTCISGQYCNFDMKGISGDDRLLLTQSCGDHTRRQAAAAVHVSVQSMGDSGDNLCRVGIPISGDLFDLKRRPLTLPGGSYQLCWCAGAAAGARCEDPSDFRVQAGTLVVEGPWQQQQFTCISGETCAVKYLMGEGISELGILQTLETCGEVPHTTSSPMVYDGDKWAADFTTPGGLYRLCWCSPSSLSNVSDCARMEDFVMDAGSILLMGPSPDQHFTCTSGQTCLLAGLRGYLQLTDSIAVLETCGIATWPTWLYASEVKEASAESGGNTWSFEWGSTPLLAPLGLYRLCWCSGTSAAQRCVDASAFRVDFGSVFVRGPESLLVESTCVSGQACSLPWGGMGMDGTGLVVVLDTCGVPSNHMGIPSILSQLENMQGQLAHDFHAEGLVLTAGGGTFRLCWCAQNSTCFLPQHFSVDMGQFTLIGPSREHSNTCVAGQSCVIGQVRGLQLSTADKVMILDTCFTPQSNQNLSTQSNQSSTTSIVLTGFWNDGISMEALEELPISPPHGPMMQFHFGPITAPGGKYRLCWCGGGFRCTSSENFLVDSGELSLLGLSSLQERRTCISGRPCSIDGFASYGDLSGSQMAVYDTCGVELSDAGAAGFRRLRFFVHGS